MRKRNYLLSAMLFGIVMPLYATGAQDGYLLEPISGADGLFDIVTVNNQWVYRSKTRDDGYEYYMYFVCAQEIKNKTVYLEVTYLDIGHGEFGVEYNGASSFYQNASNGNNNFVLGNGHVKTAVFELKSANFKHAQNLGADLRLYNEGRIQMHIISAKIYLSPTKLFLLYNENYKIPYRGPLYYGDNLVDNTSLNGKIMCGYQGWFRAAGDPSRQGWMHYVDGDFTDLTVEMWPDMLEYSADEKYPVPGWTHHDGSQAFLFSSANKKTVIRHFQWMEAYGIDGAAISRFVSGVSSSLSNESFRILSYCREAANLTGRTFYIFYDMTGIEPDNIISKMSAEWRFLVDQMKLTGDDRYLHHQGKPVIGVYGFFNERFSAADAHRILDIFQNDGPYSAYVIGSGEWWWATNSNEWKDVIGRMDAWMPWNVGNFMGNYARTDFWETDQQLLSASETTFMPLAFPGGGWDNLQNLPPGTTYVSRLQGELMWQQYLDAKNINAPYVFVAMFDEIDESTAIFKVTNDFPINHYFVGLEGLPSDFYLVMAGQAGKMIRNEMPVPSNMPDFSALSQPSVPELVFPSDGDTLTSIDRIIWAAAKHLSGINGYELEIDKNMISCEDTLQMVQLEEKNHTVRVRAINKLLNKGGWSLPVTFTLIRDDTGLERNIPTCHPVNVSAFPNPTTREITISLLQPANNVMIRIFSSTGQVLYRASFETLKEMTFPLEGHPGLYLVEISTNEGGRAMIKAIKQ